MIYMSYQQLIYYFISKSNSSEGHSCLLQTPLELANNHHFRCYRRTNCCGKQLKGTKSFLPQIEGTWRVRKTSKYCEIKGQEENASLGSHSTGTSRNTRSAFGIAVWTQAPPTRQCNCWAPQFAFKTMWTELQVFRKQSSSFYYFSLHIIVFLFIIHRKLLHLFLRQLQEKQFVPVKLFQTLSSTIGINSLH